MVRCSGISKPKCQPPCEWTTGKGCAKAVEPPKPKSPHGRHFAFLGFKDDELVKAVEALENTVSYGIKKDTTHIVFKQDKRLVAKLDAFTGPKILLTDFLTKYGFASKKVKALPKLATPATKVAKPPTPPAKPTKEKKVVKIVTPPTKPTKVATPPAKPTKVATPPAKPAKPTKVATPPAKPTKVATPPAKPTKVATPPAKPTKVATPPRPTRKAKLTLNNKPIDSDKNLKSLQQIKYTGYSTKKILKHAKAASLGMFKDDNDIRGVVDTWCYVPSKDMFVIPLKARCETDRKDKDLNTVYGVEFTYDIDRKYMISVSKDAAVILEDFQGSSSELLEGTKHALRVEYDNALILPVE
jgi:hypothetical protein